jgi:Ca2+-binding EF-hand superfamily protein
MSLIDTSRAMLRSVLCYACLAMSFSVCADDTKLNQELTAKFKTADINHDGKLTLAEAQAGMPRVAAHFSDIDTQKRGYVTLDQIMAMADSR